MLTLGADPGTKGGLTAVRYAPHAASGPVGAFTWEWTCHWRPARGGWLVDAKTPSNAPETSRVASLCEIGPMAPDGPVLVEGLHLRTKRRKIGGRWVTCLEGNANPQTTLLLAEYTGELLGGLRGRRILRMQFAEWAKYTGFRPGNTSAANDAYAMRKAAELFPTLAPANVHQAESALMCVAVVWVRLHEEGVRMLREGMGAKEISDALHVPVGTVRQWGAR